MPILRLDNELRGVIDGVEFRAAVGAVVVYFDPLLPRVTPGDNRPGVVPSCLALVRGLAEGSGARLTLQLGLTAADLEPSSGKIEILREPTGQTMQSVPFGTDALLRAATPCWRMIQ